MKYAGLIRRLFAYSLDGAVYGSVLYFVFYIYDVSIILFFETNLDVPHSLSFVVCLFGIIIIYLFDQIMGPVLFGSTFTRWICGYKIKRRDGKNISFAQSLVRYASLWILEILSLGLITFFTTLFRKDKAALHDLVSRSNAVIPEKKHILRKARILIAVAATILSFLIMFQIMLTHIYEIKIQPTKQRMLSENFPLYPPIIINSERYNTNSFKFKKLNLLNLENIDNIEICLDEVRSEPGIKQYIYSLSINNVNFMLRYEIFDMFGLLGLNPNLVHYIIKYPLFDPPSKIAEKTFHNDDIELPLLRPINNIAYMINSIVYAISTPGLDEIKILKGDNIFGRISTVRETPYQKISTPREAPYQILIIEVFGWSLEGFSIFANKNTPASDKILRTIANEVSIIETPDNQFKSIPDCQHQE